MENKRSLVRGYVWKLRCLVALLFSVVALCVSFGGVIFFAWLGITHPEIFVVVGKNPIAVFGIFGIFVCAGGIIHFVGRLLTQVGYELGLPNLSSP